MSDENYLMVDESWQIAIEAQDHQPALAGVLVGTPSVYQLPCGVYLKINPQTWEAVSVYFVFYSLNGLIMILNPKKYIVKTKDK